MKLSLITINYNNAEGLEKTILSVLSQKNLTQDIFEYIIVDGGSTDGSIEIIKKYEKDESFPVKITRWISEKDTGIYNAINKGIKLASGSLIGLLNSGDTAVENIYSEVIKIHGSFPKSILYGAVNMYDKDKFLEVRGSSADTLSSKMIAHPASFVPYYIYDKYGLYDESFRSSGDWDLFLKFYINKVNFFYINRIVVNFDTNGISSTNFLLVAKENKKLLKKYNLYKKIPLIKRIYTKLLVIYFLVSKRKQ